MSKVLSTIRRFVNQHQQKSKATHGMASCKRHIKSKDQAFWGQLDIPLNIAFRVRVSVVCIQCEQTQREKKGNVEPNKCRAKKVGAG